MAMKTISRFFLRVLLLLGIVAAAAVIFFESGLAGRYLLRTLGGRIGAELSAESIRVGLGGTVRVRRFEAVMPEEEEPFFTAHRIRITINELSELIQQRRLNITEIRIVAPSLTLRQDAVGRLNIESLLSFFENRNSGLSASGPIFIPDIDMTQGVFVYERSGKPPVRVDSVLFSCRTERDGRLQASFSLPGDNAITAAVDVQTLDHSVRIQFQDAAALSELSGRPTPAAFRLRANWTGRLTARRPWHLEAEAVLETLRYNDIEVSGSAALSMDTQRLTADLKTGRIDPWAAVSGLQKQPEPIAVDSLVLEYSFEDHLATLSGLKAALLDGHAKADAAINLRDPAQSRVTLAVEGVDLAPWVLNTPLQKAELEGALSVRPATTLRAMEPMQVDMELCLAGPFFEAAGLQNITAAGYLGKRRLVATNASIPIFGGLLSPWLNITRRDDGVFVHLIGDFEDLDLNHVLTAFTGKTRPVPGRLNGTVRCRTSGGLKMLSGSADMTLTESDLMNTAAVGTLYQAMNLQFGSLDPMGHGTVKLSAQGERLEIMSFQYFNRGVEIRGAGTIEAVTQGKQSPVSGFVTGSMRPLSGTPIAGARELDRLIGGLQAGLSSVKIEGTVGEPVPRVVPLPEVQNAFRSLLWQQLRD